MGIRRALRYVLEPFLGAATESRRLGELRGESVAVSLDALRSHAYIVGGTGTGKSRLLRVIIEQDIAACHGVCVVDPHGDLCDALIRYLSLIHI